MTNGVGGQLNRKTLRLKTATEKTAMTVEYVVTDNESCQHWEQPAL